MFELRILAVPKLVFIDTDPNRLLAAASSALKEEIVDLMLEDQPIPDPDQYEDMVNENDLVMVDPRRKAA